MVGTAQVSVTVVLAVSYHILIDCSTTIALELNHHLQPKLVILLYVFRLVIADPSVQIMLPLGPLFNLYSMLQQ